MLLGPVLAREIVIAPRRNRIYIARTAYVAALLVVMSTAWLVVTGTQVVRDVGDLARFGGVLFEILAPLQLALAAFFSALLAASAVAQEKDRRTFPLLLMTNLANHELVLGKLLASLLHVLVMFAAGLPLFMLAALLGGVSFGQIGRMAAVTVATILACGSLGSTLALWREKTFQALAMTLLALVLWLALGEFLAAGVLGHGPAAAAWAVALSPWQAILEAPSAGRRAGPDPGAARHAPPGVLPRGRRRYCGPQPLGGGPGSGLEHGPRRAHRPAGRGRRRRPPPRPPAAACGITPSCGARSEPGPTAARSSSSAWPTCWPCALAAGSLVWIMRGGQPLGLTQGCLAVLPLLLLSLVLLNAQAVTSLTAERDARALDLLLVTDLTPKEIVFGKLGGVFYNAKEMVVLPMLLCVGLAAVQAVSVENTLWLLGGLAVLDVFVAVLGLHAGMIYDNSRAAVAASLGTVFFLFLGVATCMRMMVAFSGSFHAQLPPFLAFIVGGGLGLYVTLGARNPSTAIGLASVVCPLATFYAITTFLRSEQGDMLGVFLVIVAAYGFTTAAMLVPAIYEFDVTTGRTTAD